MHQNKNSRFHEITLRGIILACLLTVLFTAANIYLGLKVGLTFATSIPAAVISMAVLRNFKNSNILEHNIVQTVTSSAGTLAAVVFILPALVMTGVWNEFPFWQTFFLTSISGILGVLYTIPLRRALVVDSDLPYPEGKAAASALIAGNKNSKENNSSIKALFLAGIIAFVFDTFSGGFKILASSISYFGRFSSGYSGIGINLSLSLIGAGYLVGIRIAISILIGLVISWGLGVPILSWNGAQGALSASDYTMKVWEDQVRFIGAGTIGMASLWAIFALIKPVYNGFVSAFASVYKKNKSISNIPTHQKDINIIWVMTSCMFLTLPIIALFSYFIFTQSLHISTGLVISMIAICTFLTMFVGFLVAAVSGYMAGLVGSSNSPISGVGILAIIIISLVLSFVFQKNLDISFLANKNFIIALAIFTTSAVFSIAAISNDNLQDLKTGHIIGATPWKQQIALIIGVIVGSAVLAPVLNELYQAYGFPGHMPRPDMNTKETLAAPQATLMAMIAKGVIGKTMHWKLFIIGIIIGLVFLCFDLFLKFKQQPRISTLAIGFGIYLPFGINAALILGGILNFIVKKGSEKNKKLNLGTDIHDIDNEDKENQKGTLFACGLIVGESLFGIILAGIIGFSGKPEPMALVGSGFKWASYVLGIIVFVLILIFYYFYAKKQNNK